MKKDRIILSFVPLFASAFCLAQTDAQEIYDGNNFYYSGRIIESSGKYARAIEVNPNNRKANFNLGDALYRNAQLLKSGKMSLPPGTKISPDSLASMLLDKAADNFAVVANTVSNEDTLHRAWHNIGNCFLMKGDFEQAITAYKKSLRFNPKDEETRYNLAYALKNKPKSSGGGQSQQQQQQQQKQQQQKQDKKEKDQTNSASSTSANKMSKEQAEQMLKALMEAEKRLQDRRKQKAKTADRYVEKDW